MSLYRYTKPERIADAQRAATREPIPSPIPVKSWMTRERALDEYEQTLTWAPEQIPAGRQAHIGGGVWRTKCRDAECDAYSDHYGSMPEYATVGPHEVEVHGMQVGGINVGMLS